VIISLGRGLLRRLDATDPEVRRNGPLRSLSRSLLLGLAPGGVYPARTVTSPAVRSYRTISPLPVRGDPHEGRSSRHRRYLFCGTFPILADGGRYPPPCPVEPGLSSLAEWQERSLSPLRSHFSLSPDSSAVQSQPERRVPAWEQVASDAHM